MKRIIAATTLILVLLISLIAAMSIIGVPLLITMGDELCATIHQLTKAIVDD